MSIVEYVRYRIDDAEAFEAAWQRAWPIIASAPGCESFELRRGVEEPTEFIARVVWTSIDHHLRFRSSDVFAGFKANFADHTIASLGHYELIDLSMSSSWPPES
jgi:heme-degrading monooxygenase HmoA